MPSEIIVKRISGSTMFKVIFLGFLAFHTISTLLVAVLVIAGILPLETTASPVPETIPVLYAVGAYLLIGILFSPIWVGALWVSIWPGVWLYSLFRPMKLRYVPHDE